MLFQSLSQSGQFGFRFLPVEQVKASNNGLDRHWTGSQYILQAAMSATRKQQTIGIERQLMTEIIMHKVAVGILHVEVLITFGHGMNLRDVR